MTNKERMQIARQDMPTQEADVRAGNFDEVALGFTLELARMEAERCLQCARPHCVEGCPVGVQIPQFIKALREGDMVGAVQAMKAKNNLPAICGRVCPQEVQCESRCLLGQEGPAGGHRPPGTLCRRFRAARSAPARPPGEPAPARRWQWSAPARLV